MFKFFDIKKMIKFFLKDCTVKKCAYTCTVKTRWCKPEKYLCQHKTQKYARNTQATIHTE